MNALKTAESLCITRNSFMPRLERIPEILNMDLNGPKVRFRLMFSLFSTEII